MKCRAARKELNFRMPFRQNHRRARPGDTDASCGNRRTKCRIRKARCSDRLAEGTRRDWLRRGRNMGGRGPACEEHQYVAVDRRAADSAALDVTPRLKHFPKRRHARLPHKENKAAGRSMTPAALPCWVRMGTMSGAITLSLSRDAATKLAR
jgi:hypothetical protein